MNTLLYFARYFKLSTTGIFCLLIFLASCDRHEDRIMDEFYHFGNLAEITLKKPDKKNYFLGIDTYAIPLAATAKDASGTSIATPAQAITYYANGNKLAGETFLPEKTGQFRLVGKLAGQVSDTIELNVWDPNTLSIRLTTVNGTVSQINANGADSVRFLVELMSGGKVIEGDFPIKIFVNGQPTADSFATGIAGDYFFTATWLGATSNTLKINALSVSSFPIIRMPVIFHEINGNQLTAATVLQLTNGMTAAFRNRLNHASQAKDINATDLFVEFYPAPAGLDGRVLPTPGLDKVTSQKTSFSQADAFSDAFSYFWDPSRYINVWVYSNITGEYLNSSWAYYPTVTSALVGVSLGTKGQKPNLPYGIFLNARHLVNQNTDEILSHEAGHMLALAHVFDGNGSSFNSCSAADPDYCSDTPYYDRGNYSRNISSQGTERFSRTACNDTRYVSTNFMDYYYSYQNSFTKDQQRRVRHAINFGLWLPTPYNNFSNGRISAQSGLVERPDNLINIKPIVCDFSGSLPNH
jgi:zinc-dependent metalloproteinase lipoprotein